MYVAATGTYIGILKKWQKLGYVHEHQRKLVYKAKQTFLFTTELTTCKNGHKTFLSAHFTDSHT